MTNQLIALDLSVLDAVTGGKAFVHGEGAQFVFDQMFAVRRTNPDVKTGIYVQDNTQHTFVTDGVLACEALQAPGRPRSVSCSVTPQWANR